MGLNAVLVVAVLAIVLALSGDDGSPDRDAPAPGPAAAAAPNVDRFDAGRAFEDLRMQVELGPRPAGSLASRRLALRLRRALPRGRFEGVAGGLRNVVGHLPGRGPAILVGAHYDTKDIPGFVGAEDGAGGTAAVLELARGLGRLDRGRDARQVRFVLFDGEESPDDSLPFYTTGLRGSRAYAARHSGEIGAAIILDFVAQKGLRIPREADSDQALWRRLRRAARTVGALSAFPDRTAGRVVDDHTPFLRQGVPAIDLIDFTFPCWHRRCDDLRIVSEASLDISGETVLELVRTLGGA